MEAKTAVIERKSGPRIALSAPELAERMTITVRAAATAYVRIRDLDAHGAIPPRWE